jgi:hypothetical protein
MGAFDTREQFLRRKNSTILWQLIENPNRAIHCQWPAIDERLFRLVEGGMEHIGTSHICNSLNGSFGHTILMMGTHTTEL